MFRGDQAPEAEVPVDCFLGKVPSPPSVNVRESTKLTKRTSTAGHENGLCPIRHMQVARVTGSQSCMDMGPGRSAVPRSRMRTVTCIGDRTSRGAAEPRDQFIVHTRPTPGPGLEGSLKQPALEPEATFSQDFSLEEPRFGRFDGGFWEAQPLVRCMTSLMVHKHC